MKYSYEEKLTAVLSVVRGQHSVSSASKHFGISYTPLSRWIARYKEFGEAGLRIRQYTYSGDFKLSAIRHMHENHLSLTETTAKFGIYNESTLSKWERIYYEENVISEILGHTSPLSLNPYIDADLVHLRECGLDISSFPVRKEVFI